MAPSPRAPLPDRRQLALGPPTAARLAHVVRHPARLRAVAVRDRGHARAPRCAPCADHRGGRSARGAAHRGDLRGPRRPSVRVPPARRARRTRRPAGGTRREGGARARPAGDHRGLRHAARPSRQQPGDHPRSRRDRSEHPADVVVVRDGRGHRHALRRRTAGAPRHREVRHRRPPHRHRWRQPRHPGCRRAGRQPAVEAARPVAQHDHVLATPPVAVVPVLRRLHRPHQPSTTRRREPSRHAL